MSSHYPELMPIEPWTGPPPRAVVRVPGSKSLTNRALIIAAMADGPSVLTGALDCEDTRVMVEALRKLGIVVEHDAASAVIRVQGCGGAIPARTAALEVANSGTSLRFLTAMLATAQGTFQLDGTPRMRQRPVADLLKALNGLGADIKSDLGTGCPPVTIQASGLDGGYAFVKGDVSSQFLSGLLMALPYASEMTTVEVQGTLVSQPYVTMTLAVMDEFGVAAENRKFRRFDVQPARLSRSRVCHRARRLRRELLLRAGGDHRRHDHRRGAGRHEPPGRPGFRGRPRVHGLFGRARVRDARPSPAAGSAPSTST